MFNILNKVKNLVLNDANVNRLYSESCAPILFKDMDCDGLYDFRSKCILLNKNIKDDKKLRETLIHECIHSYDHDVRNIDLGKVAGLMRGEIRANKFLDFGEKDLRKEEVYERCYDSVSRACGDNNYVSQCFDEMFDAIYEEESSLF